MRAASWSPLPASTPPAVPTPGSLDAPQARWSSHRSRCGSWTGCEAEGAARPVREGAPAAADARAREQRRGRGRTERLRGPDLRPPPRPPRRRPGRGGPHARLEQGRNRPPLTDDEVNGSWRASLAQNSGGGRGGTAMPDNNDTPPFQAIQGGAAGDPVSRSNIEALTAQQEAQAEGGKAAATILIGFGDGLTLLPHGGSRRPRLRAPQRAVRRSGPSGRRSSGSGCATSSTRTPGRPRRPRHSKTPSVSWRPGPSSRVLKRQSISGSVVWTASCTSTSRPRVVPRSYR